MTQAVDPTPKPWWQSRTIIGSLIVVVSAIVALFGFQLDAEIATDYVMEAIALVGGLIALYGRIAANRPISTRRVAPGIGKDVNIS